MDYEYSTNGDWRDGSVFTSTAGLTEDPGSVLQAHTLQLTTKPGHLLRSREHWRACGAHECMWSKWSYTEKRTMTYIFKY